MALAPGTMLGPYEIAAQIGAGGMGEVYRAADTKLKRQVAIKVLPEPVAVDAERLARFQREAEVLAALNHPNIAQIYGIEDAGPAIGSARATKALVMELVEGPTLAERIAGVPLPIDETLRIAAQVAEALDAAHERGIVHRDLKPANVKVRDDGTVKVLDFGLAKAVEAAPAAASSLSVPPTITTPVPGRHGSDGQQMTGAGVILGTVAYMSPEQARGRPVDKRTDIWAFGCLLFEMLTGRRAFPGDELSDVLASVLKSEPEYGALPAAVTPALRHVLVRCLEKDRTRRFRDIGDVRLLLEDAAKNVGHAAERARPHASRRETTAWITAAVLGVAALVSGALLIRGSGDDLPARTSRSSIMLPPDQVLSGTLAFSPDGSTLAFVSMQNGLPRICLRSLEEWSVRCLDRTERGGNPFFSPDGRRIAYVVDNALWAISSDGTSPSRLTESAGIGGSWAADGSLFFNLSYNQGLARIAAPGEPVTTLTSPNREQGELGHFWPQVLADGNTVIFTAFAPGQERSRIAALRVDSGEVVTLVSNAVYGRYLASGHLVFVRSNSLMAVPFDAGTLHASGTAMAVLDDVAQSPAEGASVLAISDHGMLAYVPQSILLPERSLIWADRNGVESAVSNLTARFGGALALSRDETRVAVVHGGSNPDIYLHELDSGRSARVTFGTGTDTSPVWSWDGQRIAYQSDRPPYDLYWQQTDRSGSEEALLTSEYDKLPTSFSIDDSTLVFTENRGGDTGQDIMLLPLTGSREPAPYLRTRANERDGRVSPDGRLIAYVSNQSGREEVYVDTFPEPTAARPVSIDGGRDPRWSRNGLTLFYRSGGRALNGVEIEPGPPIRVGRPTRLFEKSFAAYDVARDGRFLIVPAPDESAPRRIDIVQNWLDELTRRVPAR